MWNPMPMSRPSVSLGWFCLPSKKGGSHKSKASLLGVVRWASGRVSFSCVILGIVIGFYPRVPMCAKLRPSVDSILHTSNFMRLRTRSLFWMSWVAVSGWGGREGCTSPWEECKTRAMESGGSVSSRWWRIWGAYSDDCSSLRLTVDVWIGW